MYCAQATRRPWTVLLAALSLLALQSPTRALGQTSATDKLIRTPELAPLELPRTTATATDPILPSPALGQVHVATPDELRRKLSPGDVVSIVRTTGDAVTGRVLRIGATDLDIRTDSQESAGQKRVRLNLTIPLGAVRLLERARDSSGNGRLIGAGVGAGVGLALFVHAAAIDANEMDEWAAGYVAGGCVLTGIGALVGWAIDAVHSKPSLRFEAPPTVRTQVTAVPLFSRGPGMAVAVSF